MKKIDTWWVGYEFIYDQLVPLLNEECQKRLCLASSIGTVFKFQDGHTYGWLIEDDPDNLRMRFSHSFKKELL